MTGRTFNLLEARINAGLSQRELAAEVDVPLVTVQRLEAGLGATPRNAKKIADFFDVKATDVLPPLDERKAA